MLKVGRHGHVQERGRKGGGSRTSTWPLLPDASSANVTVLFGLGREGGAAADAIGWNNPLLLFSDDGASSREAAVALRAASRMASSMVRILRVGCGDESPAAIMAAVPRWRVMKSLRRGTGRSDGKAVSPNKASVPAVAAIPSSLDVTLVSLLPVAERS